MQWEAEPNDKHGASRRRIWRKVHIGIEAGSLDIPAIEVTKSSVGDGPVLPELLNQIPEGQEIAFVTADGAYDTRACRDAIADRGANAVIPPRRNARPWKPDTPGAVEPNEALRAIKHLGRALWKKWSDYHRRALVETKMHCIKLLGESLMAIDFQRQVTEIKARAAVLNTFTKLGTQKTIKVEKNLPRPAGVWPKSSILSSKKLEVSRYFCTFFPRTEAISVSNRLPIMNVNRP